MCILSIKVPTWKKVSFEVISSGCNALVVPFQQLLEGPMEYQGPIFQPFGPSVALVKNILALPNASFFFDLGEVFSSKLPRTILSGRGVSVEFESKGFAKRDRYIFSNGTFKVWLKRCFIVFDTISCHFWLRYTIIDRFFARYRQPEPACFFYRVLPERMRVT